MVKIARMTWISISYKFLAMWINCHRTVFLTTSLNQYVYPQDSQSIMLKVYLGVMQKNGMKILFFFITFL